MLRVYTANKKKANNIAGEPPTATTQINIQT